MRQYYCVHTAPRVRTTFPLPARPGSARAPAAPLEPCGSSYLLWDVLLRDGGSGGCLLSPFLLGIPLLEDSVNKKKYI